MSALADRFTHFHLCFVDQNVVLSISIEIQYSFIRVYVHGIPLFESDV